MIIYRIKMIIYRMMVFLLIIFLCMNGCTKNTKQVDNKLTTKYLELPDDEGLLLNNKKTEIQNYSKMSNKNNLSGESDICEKKINGPIEILQVDDLNVSIIDVASNEKDLYLLANSSPRDNKGFLYQYSIQSSKFIAESDEIDKPYSIVSLVEDKIIVSLHRTHRVYSTINSNNLYVTFPGFGPLNSIFIKTFQNRSYFWNTERFIPDQLCCADLLTGHTKWIFREENLYFSENLTSINNVVWFFGIDRNGKVYSFLLNSETGSKISEKYLFTAVKPDSYGMDVYPSVLNCEFKNNVAYLTTRTLEGIVIYCYELKNDDTIIEKWQILFPGKPRLNEAWEGLAVDFKIIVDKARVYLCLSELNRDEKNDVVRTEKIFVLNSLTGKNLWYHEFNPSDGRIRNIYVPEKNNLNDIFFIVLSISATPSLKVSATNIYCIKRDNGNIMWKKEFDFDLESTYLNSVINVPVIIANNYWLCFISKKSEYYPQLFILDVKNGNFLASFEPGNTLKRIEYWKSLGYFGENRNYILFTSNDELMFCTYDGRIYRIKIIQK